MPWGVLKGKAVNTTISQEGTKKSIGYNFLGAEGDGETYTTSYPRTKATVDVGYVAKVDWSEIIPLPPSISQPKRGTDPDQGSEKVPRSFCRSTETPLLQPTDVVSVTPGAHPPILV